VSAATTKFVIIVGVVNCDVAIMIFVIDVTNYVKISIDSIVVSSATTNLISLMAI
jgi:hypothetical protein